LAIRAGLVAEMETRCLICDRPCCAYSINSSSLSYCTRLWFL